MRPKRGAESGGMGREERVPRGGRSFGVRGMVKKGEVVGFLEVVVVVVVGGWMWGFGG